METTTKAVNRVLEDMGYNQVVMDAPVKGQIDSLDLTALIIAMEDEFDISITDEERFECRTINDHIALIESKLKLVSLHEVGMLQEIEPGLPPSIDDQIKFIGDFVADPEMSKAIRENLIALRMQQDIKHAAQVHSNRVYPLTPTEAEYISGMNSGHSFTEGMDNPYEQK